MVQLVSLMYRDQQQGTIRKLINEWLESSLPESSEDDENNPMSSSSSVSVGVSVWTLLKQCLESFASVGICSVGSVFSLLAQI